MRRHRRDGAWVGFSGVVRLVAACLLLAVWSAVADDMRLFRIGTGGEGGTYYPIGGLIARSISQPPGANSCDDPDLCGVSGLVAVAQTANGSVANVRSVAGGRLESGFAQSDVAHWAFTGRGVFADAAPLDNLRAIAALYPETVHVVARREAGIRSVRDLRGRRVSLDEPGSGTLIDARLVLQAHGLSEADISPEYIKPTLASDKMRRGELDAFFIVAGHPVSSILELASDTAVDIVPIDGQARQRLLDEYPFFTAEVIESGVYPGVGAVPTIGVRATWVTQAQIDEDLVYRITRALWNRASRRLLDQGHAKARSIVLASALDGLAIPLHPGAERYYRERGLPTAGDR